MADKKDDGEIRLKLGLNAKEYIAEVKNTLSETEKEATKSIKTVSDTAQKTVKLTYDEARKQVGKLAAVYKKQGMSSSEAFKKAWAEVGYVGKKTSKSVKEQLSDAFSAIPGFGGMLGKIGSILAAAFSINSIANFTKECLQLGSDLTEVQNVVDTTFGDMSNMVNQFASTAMESYGMSETVAKKYMGTYGAMSKAMGMSTQQAYDMSEAVTELTGDVASFFNLSTDEAYVKLKSIWTGETETLKDLGVVMTQTALDQYALNNGFGKTTASMTEQEKLLLRYRYVMSTLSDASGDFAKTSKTWANQTRILSLRFDALKASIGQGLINLFTPVLVMINSLLAGLQKLADGFAKLTSLFTGTKQSTGGIAGISTVATEASESLINMGSSASGAAKAAKRGLADFDKLHVIDSDSKSGGSGGGGASSGLDLGNAVTGQSEVLSSTQELWSKLEEGFANSFQRIKDAAGSMYETVHSNLTGAFDEWVNEDGERVKGQLQDIFSHAINTSESLADFAEALADVFGVFENPDAINITSNMLSMFEDSFLNTSLLATKFADDLVDTITSPFVKNKDVIKEGLQEMLKPLSEISDKVKDFTQDAWDTVQEAYDNYIQPAFERVKEIWTNYLGGDDFKAHLASMKASLDEINDALQPIFDLALQLFEFITGQEMASMGNGISVFGEIGLLVFKGLIASIDDALRVFSSMVQGISNLCNNDWFKALTGMGGTAKQTVTTIKNAFVGIPNWFQSVFASAWSKVQQVFSSGGRMFAGIQEGITQTFKSIVNRLVSGLNTIIRVPFNNINKMLNKIRNIKVLETTPFSNLWSQNPISIPSIPYLAKGGIVSQPTLAMVGEAGKEAVMPLENNTGWMDVLAKKIASSVGGPSGGKVEVKVYLEGDAKGVFELVKTEAENYTNTTGDPAFSL